MRIDVVTPWYPDHASVFLGVFVQQQVTALRSKGHDVNVEVAQIFPGPPGPIPPAVHEAMHRHAAQDVDAVYPTVDGATWIPCPVPARSGFAGRADAFAAGIAAKRRFLPTDGEITHAHLGVPTAAAVLDLGDHPVVVTEHQSTLDFVLDEPPARDRYREAIEQAAGFYVVAGHLRDRLITTFGPEVTDRIDVIPNIVDLTDIAFRERDHERLDRWIYVGAIAAHKGTKLLIEAFLHHRANHNPHATLTIVGDGAEGRWLWNRATEAGAGDAVRLLGPLPHHEIGPHLSDADLMVHLSPAETFGIASLEGLGAGLPVISLRNGGAEHTWGSIESIAGVLLDVGADAPAVSDSVAELADAPQRLDLASARRHVEVTYSASAVADRLLAAYTKAMS